VGIALTRNLENSFSLRMRDRERFLHGGPPVRGDRPKAWVERGRKNNTVEEIAAFGGAPGEPSQSQTKGLGKSCH